MYFQLKEREFCNALPDEVSLHGINADNLNIMRKNRSDAKGYLNRRENQSQHDMKVSMLKCINFEEIRSSFYRHSQEA